MLKDILSITGQPGLFKVVSRGSKNLIIESLVNGKRFPAFSSNKIMALEDIAIFTDAGEVPLKDVFKKIAEKEEFNQSIDPKSDGEVLKKYFLEILPNYDTERVYVSDIKKVIQWYNLMQSSNLLVFEDEEEVAEDKDNPVDNEDKDTE